MTGVNLSAPEFAYLLATVRAENVFGLNAPELFPQGDKAQEKTYQRGLDDLISNEWIQEDKERTGTYRFDPDLLEMVAIVGAPEQLIAIISHNGEEKNLLLNYLLDDRIVQLAAADDDEFLLGYLPDLDDIAQRLSEFAGVGDDSAGDGFSLPTNLFGQMQRADNAFGGKIKENLAGEGVSDQSLNRLEEAFTSGQRSEIVLVSLEGGEVAHGRRAWIYGRGENAWLFYVESAQAKQVSVVNCNRSQLEDWIESNQADLE